MAQLMDRETIDGDGGEKLLEAQAHIWNHVFNFISSMALKCAVQLGIPDIIHSHHNKPITLSELVEALCIPKTTTTYVYRLMRILVHSGFFATQKIHVTQEAQGYVLTPSSKLLLKDHCMSMSPFLLAMLDPVLVTPWHFLSDWIQKSDELITPFESANGRNFWTYCGENRETGKLFDESMARDCELVMSVVLKECKEKLEGMRSLVDVGGGTGTMCRVIAEAFPGVKCTVLDLAHVVQPLQGSENVEFVSGNMFEHIPSADVVLLKLIMHDWSDNECVKLLKRCREAVLSEEQGGKVVIIDMVLDDKNEGNYESTKTKLIFDMLMMVLVTGRERTEIEWKKLFFDAGFSGYKITPILGLRSFIEVFP